MEPGAQALRPRHSPEGMSRYAMDESSSKGEPERPEPVARGAGGWFSSRTGWSRLAPLAESGAASFGPHAWSAGLAGLLLVLLATQASTGLLLMFQYQPGLQAARSVAQLTAQAPFGWLIRGLHLYASHALLLALLAHAAATYRRRAARPPRELTWASGVLLGGLCFALALTGSILVGDQHAATAGRVMAHLLASLPLAGPWLAGVAAGGLDFSDAMMHRAFALHASALPAGVLLWLAGHLWLVRVHGLTPRGRDRQLPARWYPEWLLRHAVLWLVLLFALAAVAALWPAAAPVPADPLEPTAAGFKPTWPFLPLYQVLRLLPPRIAGIRGESLAAVAGLLAAACLVVLPCGSNARAARIASDVFVVTLAGALGALGVWGWLG
jgi:ubiquinol-cytochrome c reductase cytochrome b subunit